MEPDDKNMGGATGGASTDPNPYSKHGSYRLYYTIFQAEVVV